MLSEWVGLASLIVANAVINIGIYKYFNARIEGVYGRIDEVKDKVDKQYVRKEVCSVMHATTADNLKSIEVRITERIDKLEKEVSKNFDKLIDTITKK